MFEILSVQALTSEALVNVGIVVLSGFRAQAPVSSQSVIAARGAQGDALGRYAAHLVIILFHWIETTMIAFTYILLHVLNLIT